MTKLRGGPDPFLSAHLDDIRLAQQRIAPHVRRTPLVETDVGLVKPECLQVTGSFKPRGAFNAVLSLLAARPSVTGVAAVSSGNHGQAVALAASRLDLPAVIVMPEDSSPIKVGAVQRLGASVVQSGVTVANRDERFAQVVAETGYAPIHPYDDWDVIHGQATLGAEIAADLPDVSQVIVPVGGGGMASGVCLAVKALVPEARVIAVEPEAASDAAESFRTGRHVRRPPRPTLADGARPEAIGERPYEVLVERRLLDGVVTVSEPELAAATLVLLRAARLAAEPTGALTMAGVLSGGVVPDAKTVLVVSGGNFDPARIPDLVAMADPELVEAGLWRQRSD